MIITTPHQMKIGEQRRGMFARGENDTEWHEMPYVVIRVATREEWRQGCIDEGLPVTVEPDPDYYFYQVSID